MGLKSFIVYKSSAGSGKTYTLVKEYLKLVLSNPSKVRNILAITFTNAASAEMKERIIEALASITEFKKNITDPQTKDNNIKKLIEQIGYETSLKESTIYDNSEKVLYYILHNYNDLSISTIDSFTHRVLRTFAFDLRIPVNFEIEFDTQQVIEQAADILVNHAGQENNEELTNLLVSFIESRTDEERSFAIEREIVNMAKNLLNENSINYIDKLKALDISHFMKVFKILSERIESFQEKLINLGNKGLQSINDANIPVSSMAQGKNGMYSWFKKLSDERIMDSLPPNKTITKILNENKWHSAKAKEADIKQIEAITPKLQNIANEIIQVANDNLSSYIISNNIRQNLFSLALINEMEKTMDIIRQEENILFISDLNKKISDVVAHEHVPFIYERIGEKYHNFMIDEFQDTSVLQWQNMLPLIDNGLAEGNMSLLVGDAKQSIYRWRGGDAYQFIKLPHLTENIYSVNKQQVEKTLTAHYCQVPENPDAKTTNFRSLENIVNFNNDFFETIKSGLPELIKDVYYGHQQKSIESKAGGYVELSFITEKKGDKATFEEETVKKIENIIDELTIADNYSYHDISILCRKKKEATIIAQHLTQRGLHVISEESLLLSNSPKVTFLISFLKLINDFEDNIAITECLDFLINKNVIRQPDNLHLCIKEVFTYKNNESFNESSFERFINLLKKNDLVIPSLIFSAATVYEIIEEITRLFFPSKQTIDPYLTFFLDCVHEYQQKQQNSITEFLKYWDENSQKLSLTVPDKLNAIKVITIHKSKGLQFPVVIYPFAKEKIRWQNDDGFWINTDNQNIPEINVAYINSRKSLLETDYANKYLQEQENQLLDMVNLAYVAFTRPQEKLYVVSSIPENGIFPKNSLNELLYDYLRNKSLWNEKQLTYCFPGQVPGNKKTQYNSQNTTYYENKAEETWLKYHINRPWKNIVTVKLLGSSETQNETKKLTRGKLIHKAMENIIETEDLPFIMEQLIMDGYITKDEKDHLENKINSLISNPLIKQFFSKEYIIKTEPGIFDDKGSFYRPDRIAFSQKQTAIIDYKTGQQHDKHLQQIYRYGKLLENMNYPNIKLFVAYIDLNIIEEVKLFD